jgi:hypothetical protein
MNTQEFFLFFAVFPFVTGLPSDYVSEQVDLAFGIHGFMLFT